MEAEKTRRGGIREDDVCQDRSVVNNWNHKWILGKCVVINSPEAHSSTASFQQNHSHVYQTTTVSPFTVQPISSMFPFPHQ